MKCSLHQPALPAFSRESGCTCPNGIDSFSGKWAFLSNFYPGAILYEGVTYPSVEHAFQAAKTLDPKERLSIARAPSAGASKRMGRLVTLRSDWEDIKDSIMLELLTDKFHSEPLSGLLMATGQIDLTEGNTWHDQHWGDCACPRHVRVPGKNMLGKLLEQVRSSLRVATSSDSGKEPGRGLFITFEGGECSGKTTQSRQVAVDLEALWTREPGGTELGTAIRELCLGPRFDPDPVAELLLMAADRAEHVQKVILPALKSGRNVVCDRYTNSTRAYQGAGRGMDAGLINQVTDIATCGLEPDLVIVIHVNEDVAARRQAARGEIDRMEQTGDEFHRRVRQSYLDQANDDPTMVIIDGDASEDEVRASVYRVLSERLGLSLG
jgi:dTMP kinase